MTVLCCWLSGAVGFVLGAWLCSMSSANKRQVELIQALEEKRELLVRLNEYELKERERDMPKL